ncbi:MAG: hypothetical protein JST13_10425, partial [Bacteroidetes bacterium]|nr:hypothetical protein [Bacteroidota bacterium]
MKRTQIIAITFCLLFFSVACHRGNTISIINDDDNLYINYNGEIKFNDDETVISSISHNGYLKYRRNEKRLNAENGVDGRIKYEMYVNGRKLNADDVEGKQFLADVVKDMIDIGFDAKGRLDRLYRKGGTEAVLNNFDNLKMDFVKNMYLEYLLSIDGLSEDQVKSIARKIALGSGSDYDKGRLLEK